MRDLVSVIIPVYNVKEYLQTCIDSVRNQRYTDLQIIIVDDGSTDGSGAICDEAAKADERITTIHQTNGGLSAARNKGLEAAVGKYVCFLDSDDWFNEDYVYELYDIAEREGADIAVCDFIRVSGEDEANAHGVNGAPATFTTYDNKQAVREVIEEQRIKSLTWNKLYKRILWENVRFPMGKLHEDEYTTYKLLWKAEKVVETDRVLYYYRKRAGSVTETTDDLVRRRRAFELVDAQKERYEFFKVNEPKLAGIAFTHYMDCLKYVIRSDMIIDYYDKKEIIKAYGRGLRSIWTVPYVSLYKRVTLSAWAVIIRFV